MEATHSVGTNLSAFFLLALWVGASATVLIFSVIHYKSTHKGDPDNDDRKIQDAK